MQRKQFAFMMVLAACLGAPVTVVACKDSGSKTESSKNGFRLSLSKREVPVASKVVRE
jgi:hypothetical protein